MNEVTNTDEEKELLLRLQSGEEAAFTAIYNLYWKKMFYVAAQKLQNLAEAEEVVQDIFLDLWKRKENLPPVACLSAYLSVCVKYKVINILARRQQQWRYTQQAISQPFVHDHSLQQKLQAEELKEQIKNETARLPEKCRLVFEMSRQHGFSQKQIAARLGISEKTVESHISKAIRTLRTSLSQLMALLFLESF